MKTKTCSSSSLSPTSMKKELGQYFTISDTLQQFVFDHVKHKGECLLEPSFGAGHLLQKFKEYDPNYPMVCYELDATLSPIVSLNEHQTIVYADFTENVPTRLFKTIVTNPPYVKQKGGGNLYIRFLELCYDVLEDGGEMLCIVPSDFLKLTSASTLLTRMTDTGCFTDVLMPHNERLFEGASIDVIVFRYEKGASSPHTLVNGVEKVCQVKNGIVLFRDIAHTHTCVDTLFHVYVGIVSGRDEVYRHPRGNIRVLTDKERIEPFLFPETFPTGNEDMDTHLLAHKAILLERKIKVFTETNWFEWGAPRNIQHMKSHAGKPCIYVRTITRKQDVAFRGIVQYFGGTLLCLIPRETLSVEQLDKIVAHLNSAEFQSDYTYAGRFKIGQKLLCNATLPPQTEERHLHSQIG